MFGSGLARTHVQPKASLPHSLFSSVSLDLPSFLVERADGGGTSHRGGSCAASLLWRWSRSAGGRHRRTGRMVTAATPSPRCIPAVALVSSGCRRRWRWTAAVVDGGGRVQTVMVVTRQGFAPMREIIWFFATISLLKWTRLIWIEALTEY